MLLFFTRNLLWTEGLVIIGALALVGLIGLYYRPLLYTSFLGFIFCLFFFRNPERFCPEALQDQSVLICPSDGKVLAIEKLENNEQFAYKVAIFLSPLDVHVNWLPALGTIKEVVYHQGAFAMAFLPKSSELNERNDVLLQTQTGKLILVRQIAGTIARTIVCWVKPGDIINQTGKLFGMIKFGSRIEIFLPQDAVIDVTEGQRVYGGQTVLGKLQ
ncbi:MAG: phosphatidylserine decarboxylase family protein [Proteobacteria bacterium]|nr:phosphatidylserine decarboxylase family protein [Pseudomonadota bacterium]NBP14951.1 phosphatidylserine decarboxylase family protein [bacterium]